MQTKSILVVEPDRNDRQRLLRKLSIRDYDVREAESATAAALRLRERTVDLILLEWVLPELSGLDFLNDFIKEGRLDGTRVLMTSGRGHSDAIAALDAGADDFMAKPYDLEELSSRIAICLSKPPIAYSRQKLLGAGPILIDDISHRVSIDGHFVNLGPREYRLLHFFLSNPDRLFSRKQMLAGVWKHHDRVGERTVDVHVRRLRSHLSRFNCDDFIQTIRGEGYRFSVQRHWQSAMPSARVS